MGSMHTSSSHSCVKQSGLPAPLKWVSERGYSLALLWRRWRGDAGVPDLATPTSRPAGSRTHPRQLQLQGARGHCCGLQVLHSLWLQVVPGCNSQVPLWLAADASELA